MKQTAAIFFLLIFSFNIIGYRLLYKYISYSTDIQLESSLDNNYYDNENLVTIKHRVILPYYTNSKIFQRVNGEVNFNGVIYKYVKCRIYKDSLEMLCIPHIAKMKIKNSKQEFFKLVNDLQQASDDKNSAPRDKQIKSTVSEYEEILNTTIFHKPSIMLCGVDGYCTPMLPDALIKSAEQPPDKVFRFIPS